ncbi:MAG: transglycosylase domain-containing protein, partial [Clostridia bacterium]|nr:transglycosylase domain-containing protein [Clostridia bacterium]
MKKFAKILLFSFLVLTVISLSVTAWYFAVTKDVEFDDDKLKKYESNCIIYDKNNEKIPLLSELNYTSGDKIPETVKNAFVAIEDRRFYLHSGIDLKAILRAAKNNFLSLSLKEGASTISQQLVKNTFLSGEKTLKRKMKELKLTLELEKKYSKDEILEIYLNTVYFGEGATGIGAAAKKYFGCAPGELTVSQAATLAGLIKSPSAYDPYKNYSLSKSRRNVVLEKMAEENFITKTECERFKNEEIILNSENFYEIKNCFYDSVLDEALS